MQITGEMLIGQHAVRGTAGEFRALDPALGRELDPPFGAGGPAEVERACRLAQQAFDSFRNLAPERRAVFLETIAHNILALGDALIERAMAESGLPRGRLEGERARTVGQLRLFAEVVRAGHWTSATIDPALPERTPPRADLRLRKIGVGPVAVFGASNFPLAFSVAGGDTASAFAAGCPVVVKAHRAHMGTAELVGRAVQQAVAECGLHEGVFSLLIGAGNSLGDALVAHPAIKAVGFTGSRQGGMALMATAANRPEPIPVFAEMSSVNPVFLFPAALAARAEQIAAAFVDSLTLGAGQFCTNPGIAIGVAGPALTTFRAAATAALAKKRAATMLTPGIHDAYQRGVDKFAAVPGVTLLGRGDPAATTQCAADAALFETDAQTFIDSPTLEDEIFGPAALLVSAASLADFQRLAEALGGQLTATLQLDPADYAQAGELLPILERKAGRILVNGFPTGVEVSYAMVHGGPFPATSNSSHTSVGASAIDRFLRPVCYQDMPAALLPAALQDSNPLGLWRLKDGQLSNS